jgi:hypothetical protein
MSQSAQSANNFLIQNLPNEVAELSDEALWQVQGAWRYLDNLYNVTVQNPLVAPMTPVKPAYDWPVRPPNPDILTHSHTDSIRFAL